MTKEQLEKANKLNTQIVRLRNNITKLKQGLEYYHESSLQRHLVNAYACQFYVSKDDIIKSITNDINEIGKAIEDMEKELLEL
jgi:hypothetical protein